MIKFFCQGHKWWHKFSQIKIDKKEEAKIEQNRPASANKSKVKDSKITQPKSNVVSKPVVKKNTTQQIPKTTPAGKTVAKNTHECKPAKTMPENPVSEKTIIEQPNSNESVKLEKNPKIEIKINIDKNILFNQCQLYLARVYSRLKQFDLSKQFYLKVIENEPKVNFKLIFRKLKLKDKIETRSVH